MPHLFDGPAFEQTGFAVVSGVVPAAATRRLKAALGGIEEGLRRRDALFGARNLLALESVRELAAAPQLRELIEPIVGASARPVRALFFDKTPGANWPVLWHQDLTVALAKRHEIRGWGPWSVKTGMVHVEPPETVLRSIMTVRLHLDDCGIDSGPLRVLPGTHRLGRLSRERIEQLRFETPETVCLADEGSAVVMRPLLVHGSGAAARPTHRRVIHLEFAAEDLLPAPLEWSSTA